MLPGGLAHQAVRQGSKPFDEFDTKIDPVHHNVLVPANQRAILDDCDAGVYEYGHIGVPCTTFTTILALQRRVLRLRSHPWKRPGLQGRDALQVDEANVLVRFSIRVALAIARSGGEVTLENVGDRGDPSLPHMWWQERSSMCSLALIPDFIALIQFLGLTRIDLSLCSFHDHDVLPLPPVKWISIWATRRAAELLQPLQRRGCPRPGMRHTAAVGRTADGTSRAGLSAAYPEGLNGWLGYVAATLAGDARGAAEPAPVGAQIGCGQELSPGIRQAIEQHRHALPRFADFRKLRAVPAADRWQHPYPTTDVLEPEFEPATADDPYDYLEDGPDDERPSSFLPGLERPIRSHHGIPGLPPGRVTYEMIWRRIPEAAGRRVGYEMVLDWTRRAFESAPFLRSSSPHEGPGTVTVTPDLKESWARLVLLDTRDTTDVVRMRRSTRDTIFAGPLQIDRAALRLMAEEVEWYQIDPDILNQAAEGGLEARTSCPRYTLLAWHHNGVKEHFDAAHAISVKEYNDQWLIGPFPLPPTEPCRVIPSNVVMQHRAKVDEGGNFHPYLKPRVTANLTLGDDDSPNAGVARGNKTTQNPSHQTHAASSAVTHGCYQRAGEEGGQYVTDLTSAFSFLLQQRRDWWLQVRFWSLVLATGDIRTGFFVQPRLLFGGTWGPNRFNRTRRIKTAWTKRRQAAFDALHPPPAAVLDVIRERAALQQAGILPPGEEQLQMSSLQGFIDDESGSSGCDLVQMPAELLYIDVATIISRTLSSGARPAPASSRVMVHCCFSIAGSERIGLVHAMDKVQCGDCVVVLGLRSDLALDRSDCPPPKSASMCAELRHMQAEVAAKRPIPRDSIARNVGRLSNISQIAPELLLYLHAGYALACAHARAPGSQYKARLQQVKVAPGKPVGDGFVSLLEAAVRLLEGGCSVPLLIQPSFPAHGDAGVVTICSDASGADGVGGFGLHPAHPKRIWVVHGAWPERIRDALLHSSRTPRQRAAAGPQPRCSMPAAELFGPWAVAAAMAGAGLTFSAAIAVMDCKPATAAITATKSRSSVMRGIVRATSQLCESWLGVHIQRELNTDCDLLSHPSHVRSVVKAASDAGYHVTSISISDHCFDQLISFSQSAFDAERQCLPTHLAAHPPHAPAPSPPIAIDARTHALDRSARRVCSTSHDRLVGHVVRRAIDGCGTRGGPVNTHGSRRR